MPPQVSTGSNLSLSCLICYKTISPLDDVVLKNSAHILSDLFKLFCKFMKLEPRLSSPTISSIRRDYSFDFTKEQFPFCDPCKSGLVNLFKLNEQLEVIQKQIDSVTSQFTAHVIESCGLEQRRDRKYDKEFSQLGKRDANVLLDQNTRRKVLGLRKRIRRSYQVQVRLTRDWEQADNDLKSHCLTSENENTEGKNNGSKFVYHNNIRVSNSEGKHRLHHLQLLSYPEPSCDSPAFVPVHGGDSTPVVVVSTPTLDFSNKNTSYPILHSFPDEGVIEIDIIAAETDIDPAAKINVPTDPSFVTIEELKDVNLIVNDSNCEDLSVETDQEENEGLELEQEVEEDNDRDASYIVSNDEESDSDNDEEYEKEINEKEDKEKHSKITKRTSKFVKEESPGKFIYRDKFYFEKNVDLLQCLTCNNFFDSWTKCLTHIRQKHFNPVRFACLICGKSHSDKIYLETHMWKIHKEVQESDSSPADHLSESSLPYKCNKCRKSFKASSSLHFHKTRHNCANDYKYQCDEPGCGKMLYSPALLEEHKRCHSKPHKCHICSKSFGYDRVLKFHLKMHEGTQYYCCPEDQCSRRFRRRYQLKLHVETIHGTGLPEKTRTGMSSVDTSVHDKNTERRSRTICDVCGKTVPKGGLKQHLKFHQYEKHVQEANQGSKTNRSSSPSPLPYSCSKCGKQFKHSSTLFFHKTRQNCVNDYEYKCDEPGCGKMLYSPALLEEHSKVHLRPFKCHICSKAFGYDKALQYHLRVHSGTQYHLCPEEGCDRKYRRRYELEDHMISDHGTNPPIRVRIKRKITAPYQPKKYPCNDCGKPCKTLKLLNAHVCMQMRYQKIRTGI